MSDFDSLSYAQKLREVGVPQEQAEAEAELIRDQVLARAATKGDLVSLEERLTAKMEKLELKLNHAVEQLRTEMKLGDQKMTATLGGMIVGATVILLAAMGLLATWLAG